MPRLQVPGPGGLVQLMPAFGPEVSPGAPDAREEQVGQHQAHHRPLSEEHLVGRDQIPGAEARCHDHDGGDRPVPLAARPGRDAQPPRHQPAQPEEQPRADSQGARPVPPGCAPRGRRGREGEGWFPSGTSRRRRRGCGSGCVRRLRGSGRRTRRCYRRNPGRAMRRKASASSPPAGPPRSPGRSPRRRCDGRIRVWPAPKS